MHWTYITYLPAVVSALWPLAIFARKKHPTRAQLLLSAAMLMVAFALVMGTVILRGRTYSLFIYQYLLQLVAILAGPVYYIAICALTEPRGSSLRQRHSLVLPLLFILALSLLVLLLGPRRYEHLCLLFRYRMLFPLEGDTLWNLTSILSYPVFTALLLATDLPLLFMASRKCRVYQSRFNSYYAEGINAPKHNSRPIHIIAWLFLPLALAAVLIIALRPAFQKYLLVAIALLLSVLQFLLGRYTYSLDFDARYLAQIVKMKNEKMKNEE
ncbi:MAG: hypothetical protein J6I49_01525 [Bacteroidales bacterium]|nr:hypothetical protein [Bacteroidales bacterium]